MQLQHKLATKYIIVHTVLTIFRSSINSFSLLNSSYIAYKYATNVTEL